MCLSAPVVDGCCCRADIGKDGKREGKMFVVAQERPLLPRWRREEEEKKIIAKYECRPR